MSNQQTKFSRAWNSRGMGVAAAIVVGMMLLFTVGAVVLTVTAPPKEQSAPTDGASVGRSTAAAAPAKGPCQVPVGDTSLTPAVPTDLRWEAAAGGMAWPVSASVGPTKTKDGFGTCFAQSPLGAAFAAASAVYASSFGSDLVAATEFYVANSAGKAASVEKARGFSASGSSGIPAGVSLAGFRVESFTPERAVVNLVLSHPSGKTGYVTMPVTLAWTDDDWRVQVYDNGEWFMGSPANLVDGQFTRWEAVR
jgi:hypothetical protein